jgi:hypothetical protein
MAGCLVTLDKCPGVCPLGIGETWWHLCAKLILLACGSNAKKQYGINQLCAGLEAGIEVLGIHAISELWSQCKAEEED